MNAIIFNCCLNNLKNPIKKIPKFHNFFVNTYHIGVRSKTFILHVRLLVVTIAIFEFVLPIAY